MDRGGWRAIVHRSAELDMTERLALSHFPRVPGARSVVSEQAHGSLAIVGRGCLEQVQSWALLSRGSSHNL